MAEISESSTPEQSPLGELSERMRAEWDRRVGHDYRYWMSDGVSSDERMWESGRRDLEILLRGIDLEQAKNWTALELGCGVGRLLRASAAVFCQVLGVDVSQSAVEEAQRLLADLPNVKPVLGNGVDLSLVRDGQLDFVYTFAALSSMPLRVISRYLLEISRVLKVGGQVRLQLYLGNPQPTCEEDTLAIRVFREEDFRQAMEALGFQLETAYELVLPFEVSNQTAGFVATIVGLTRVCETDITEEQLAELLLPQGENAAGESWKGSQTEYLMAVHRAQQHMEFGRSAEAHRALEFAVEHYGEAERGVKDVLAKLTADLSVRAANASNAHPASTMPQVLGEAFKAEFYEQNLRALADRFPEAAQAIQSVELGEQLKVSYGENNQPALSWGNLPLDQQQKPKRAAEVWAERALGTERVRRAEDLVVFGFAGGYHLEALRSQSQASLHVIEPNLQVLKAALAVRDCRELICGLASLWVSVESFGASLDNFKTMLNVELLTHPQTKVVEREAIDQVRHLFWADRGLAELHPSIAVVGPIYGGSLPIAAYTENAFKSLKQLTYGYDLGGFHGAYREMHKFVKDHQRTNTLEANYVEMLSQIVLEAITEKPVDIVVCLAQAPLSARVLTELRKRGIITVMWFVEDCNRFVTWQEISRYYDYMFIIQRGDHLQKVQAAGAGRAIYLPVGCDPQVHRPVDVSPEEKKRWGSQVSFVGAGYNNRQQVFAALAKRDFKIWGTEWPTCAPFDRLVQERGRRISPEEYVKIFNSSEINLNLHSSMERDGVEPNGDFVNPRTFELAAAGAFQLVDNRALLPELFNVGSELSTFSDRKEMEDKIDYFLAHPEERVQFQNASRERALTDHTYEKRIKTMLGHIYADRYEELRAKRNDQPWNVTLKAAEAYPDLKQRFEQACERGMEPKLESLVADIQTGNGSLTEMEQRLLFLHHIKTQIVYVNNLRTGKSE